MNQFKHAFFESTRRDGIKDGFSRIRAERMNWIDSNLTDRHANLVSGVGKQAIRVKSLRHGSLRALRCGLEIQGLCKWFGHQFCYSLCGRQ